MRFSGSSIKIILIPLTALIVMGMLIFLRPATDDETGLPEDSVLDLARFDIATAEPEATENPLVRWNKYERMLSQDIAAKDVEGEIVPLRAGQVVFVYTREEYCIDASTRFFSHNEEELFFDRSFNEPGTLLLSGIPADLLLVEPDACLFGEKTEINGETGVMVREVSKNERVIYQVDWDGDGVKDEVSVEPIEGLSVRVLFHNGADGNITTIVSDHSSVFYYVEIDDYYNINQAEIEYTKYLAVYWSNLFMPHDFSVLLYQDESNRYAIMLGKDLCRLSPNGFDPYTVFIRFDPVFGLSDYKVKALYDYDGKDFYRYRESRFLGDIWTIKEKVELYDDYSTSRISDSIDYLNGCVENVYTLRPIKAQIQGSGGFYSSTLEAGTAIKPIRLELDANGEGFLYVRLFDGKTARIQTSFDEESNIGIIDGGPQNEAVVCYKAEYIP